jgi:hypothetical protein
MNVDLDQGTDPDQPADDIRSQLEASFTEVEGGATDKPDTPAAGKTTTDGEPDAGAAIGERVRGPDGKFLKKDETADAPAAGKTTAAKPDKTATITEDPAAKVAAPATDTKDAPVHWAQADKDKFNALAPDAKAFVLDRFKAMEGDYTRKTQAVAHLQKEYGPVNEMFTPHMDVMRQKGFTPRTLIESWANVEMKLAGGTDSAVDVIKGLVGGYNIPVAKIAAALGLTPAQAQAAATGTEQNPTATQNGTPVALPPEIVAELKALRDSVSGVTSWKTQQEQQAANQRRAIEIEQENAVSNQVNEFKSAVDDKGSPLHPHFDEVEAMMTSLAHAALASKQPVPSLQQLYETAVYANPTTREKVLTAQRQQEEATRVEAARAKAASARRAGSSVTGAPGSGQAPSGKSNPTDTIRGSLEAAFDDIEA